MVNFRSTLLTLPLLWALSALPASAVIVAGTLGTGNNNNTQAGLDAYLSSEAYADFVYWDNLVRVSNASGVYLGYNASTMRGWVLSANHINPEPPTINVSGNAYTVTGTGTQIGTSDLILYEIGGGVSDPTLPTLPSVVMASSLAATSESSLMFGRGFTNNVSSPYSWVNPGTNDANGMRWASNTVENTVIVDIDTSVLINLQPYVYVDFDAAGDPGVTAYDGQGSLGDSGGGLFIQRGGQWELSGAAHFVDKASAGEVSQPGDLTFYSDVFSHLAEINAITGNLIPEPSVISLTGLAALALFRRRRY